MGLITAIMTSLFNKAITPSSSAASRAASTAADVIDTLFTSDEERLDKQAVLARVALHADALQAKINTTYANLFKFNISVNGQFDADDFTITGDQPGWFGVYQ